MKRTFIFTLLLCPTVLCPVNAFACTAQADGAVDQSFINEANKQLALLPDYVLDAMDEDGVNLYVTDKDIDSYFCDGQYGSVQGLTITQNHHTDIYIEDREKAVCNATLHEIGHWVDDYYEGLTNTNSFVEIYQEESAAFQKAFLINFYYDCGEFFAEGFWKYLTASDTLRDNCPQLYAYIDGVMMRIQQEQSKSCNET